MKNIISKIILLLLAGFALHPFNNANATLYTVNGTAGPWEYNGSLNSSFAYGVHDQAPATVVVGLTLGYTVTLSYVSGLVHWAPSTPTVDANGALTNPNFAGPSNPNGAGPGYYSANPSTENYLSQLIGVFTDGTGQIVGLPFGVGNGPISFPVPSGATQLQLGKR